VFLAAKRTLDLSTELSVGFATARPFPHVVVEDALSEEAGAIQECFPSSEWEGWHRYPDEYQRGKMICSEFDLFPSPIRDLITELNGPRFLSFLEKVSGIRGLLPDPYLEGGGLHCSGPGGILATHTDFHLYQRLQIYRRLNVLLYLNHEWDESWGGCLELYEPGSDRPGSAPVKTVVPRWGTLVIFQTDDRSPHGFTRPIAEGHSRRSVALYYYTASEASDYSGDTSTYWRQGREQRLDRRARQLLYSALIFISRAIAFVAHRVDPKLARRSETRD
jgi:hypothetical protein